MEAKRPRLSLEEPSYQRALQMVDVPNEVLENIFAFVPINDLLLNVAIVCTRFRDLVQSSTFLPKKKFFYKFKNGRCKINRKMRWDSEIEDCSEEDMASTGKMEECLPWLMQVMEKSVDKIAQRIPNYQENVFSKIRRHKRYPFIKEILKERFPELAESLTAATSLILLTSVYASDIRHVMNTLLAPPCSTFHFQVTEFLYELATFLLYCQRETGIPPKIYYMIMQTLHNYNDFGFVAGRQVESTNFSWQNPIRRSLPLTPEQVKIVDFDLQDIIAKGGLLNIEGLAGTGKKTTLIELCRKNPNVSFLLIASNRTRAFRYRRMFPANVMVKTLQSIAAKYIRESHGVHRFTNHKLKPHQLLCSKLLKLMVDSDEYSALEQATFILDCLDNFYKSMDKEIKMQHVSERQPHNIVVRSSGTVQPRLNSKLKQHVLDEAKQVYMSITNRSTGLTFDFESAVKEFQLKETYLKAWAGPHQVLLLPDAQDLPPVAIDIAMRQNTSKIVAGDVHQAFRIYRDSDKEKNVFKQVRKYVRDARITHLRLNHSFRLGAEIGFLATSCLSSLQGLREPDLLGSWHADSISGGLNSEEKITFLSSSPGRLLREISARILEVENKGCRPYFAIPSLSYDEMDDPFSMDFVCALQHFMDGNFDLMNVPEEFKIFFQGKTIKRLEDEAIFTNDHILYAHVTFVKDHGEKVFEYAKIYREKKLPISDPRVKYVFSTAEWFQGLESENVQLLDDFYLGMLPYFSPGGQRITAEYLAEHLTVENFMRYFAQGGPNDDTGLDLGSHYVADFNILYSAITRAKRNLVMNASCFFLLNLPNIGYNFEGIAFNHVSHPRLIDKMSDTEEIFYSETTCARCGRPITATSNGYLRGVACGRMYDVQVSSGAGIDKFQEGGLMCHGCSDVDRKGINSMLADKNTGRGIPNPGTILNLFNIFYRKILHALETPKEYLKNEKEIREKHKMYLEFLSLQHKCKLKKYPAIVSEEEVTRMENQTSVIESSTNGESAGTSQRPEVASEVAESAVIDCDDSEIDCPNGCHKYSYLLGRLPKSCSQSTTRADSEIDESEFYTDMLSDGSSSSSNDRSSPSPDDLPVAGGSGAAKPTDK